MKQSRHINPSEETGTGCAVTSKYGRTPPNKHTHGVVGRQQHEEEVQPHWNINQQYIDMVIHLC